MFDRAFLGIMGVDLGGMVSTIQLSAGFLR